VPEESILVLSTFPDADSARRAARALIEEKLAACANLIPQIESVYRWKGAIETSSEVLLLIKSNVWKFQPLEAKIRELHPYEVPEIISLRIDSGSADYLRWIDESVL
jgi:periplasmic divalent cation tolerance protein